MADKLLYAAIIPEAGTTSAGTTASQEQTLQALLNSDTGSVESIASNPGERSLTVEFAGTYADVRARELAELATGLSQPLPYHAVGATSPDDRYVTVSRAEPGPVDPRSADFQRVDNIALSDVGTIASHWREVQTSQSQVDHPFGNDTTAPVGVPAAAAKVRWLDRETKATADPTVQATRAAQYGDVDILDAEAAPYDNPSVIFELEYDDEGWVDPRLWDTRGFGSIEDADGATQWQKVFATSHRVEGDLVLENGLLRLTFDEAAGTISAERWDSGTSSWTDEALGTSDWELFDIDVRSIGLSRVRARVEFVDPTASPTAYYSLSMRFSRGDTNALWVELDGEGGVPTGLVDKLDPIAASHIYDPHDEQGLRARDDL